MSLLHCDSFDHYGGDTAQMLLGIYAALPVGAVDLVTTHARTGAHSLQLRGGAAVRRVMAVATPIVGVGFVCWFDNLPSIPGRAYPIVFMDRAATPHIYVMVQTTGAIEVYLNGGALLGSSAPVLTTGAWQHIEARAKIDIANGEVEVRVNGVTVFAISGVRTRTIFSAYDEVAQIAIQSESGLSSCPYLIDDLFVWDSLGGANNDFLGDRRVMTDFPSQDTVIADWVKSAGVNGYALINERPADDGATYLESITYVAPGDQSAFDFTLLPPEVAAVSGIIVLAKTLKTDAGPANARLSILSGPAEGLGADRTITQVWSYRADVFELNPNTGAPWTRAEVNAAQIAIRRTL